MVVDCEHVAGISVIAGPDHAMSCVDYFDCGLAVLRYGAVIGVFGEIVTDDLCFVRL